MKETMTKKTKKTKVQFLHKPTCTSCRNARALLEKEGVEMAFRDLKEERLSVEELDRLIGDRDYRKFLNFRNELYRERKMGENPPSRAEALRLMADEPNLIRRPVVICGDEIVLGFDQEALKKLAD
jgi:Spx/MgsR family transcriptional regulator